MEEETKAIVVGLVYGLTFSLSFDLLVNVLQVFINLIILGLPIFAAVFFPKWFPQSYKAANRLSYLGIFLGALSTAIIIINKNEGFGAIAGILLIPLSLIYIAGYAIIIAIIHNLITHPEEGNKSLE